MTRTAPQNDFAGGYLRLRHQRLDRLIQRLLEARGTRGESELAGLYISDSEVHALTADRAEAALPIVSEETRNHFLERALRENCGLDDLDVDLLHAIAAPLLDEKYLRLYGFLHDNVSRETATPGLLYGLLAGPGNERHHLLARLQADAPLRRYGFIELEGETLGPGIALRPAEAVPLYLSGAGLSAFRRFHPYVPVAPVRTRLAQERIQVWCVEGPAAADKSGAARRILGEQGYAVLELNCAACEGLSDEEFALRSQNTERIARLYGAAVLLRNLDQVLETPVRRRSLSESFADLGGIAAVALTAVRPLVFHAWLRETFAGARVREHTLEQTGFQKRRQIWEELLPPELQGQSELLAARFAFSS